MSYFTRLIERLAKGPAVTTVTVAAAEASAPPNGIAPAEAAAEERRP